MAFQSDPTTIVWRLRLASSPESVYSALDTDTGRAAFWAESAVETDGFINFSFINEMSDKARILTRRSPEEWSIEYFSTVALFNLAPDGAGGTDLTVTNHGVEPKDRCEITAGWLNVLLPFKAWVDHGIDLRSHDPTRTWDNAYVDQ